MRAGWVMPLLGVVLLFLAGFGLHRAIGHLRGRDIWAAVAQTPGASLLHALGWLLAAVVVMAAYDVPGALYARRLQGDATVGRAVRPGTVFATSFCAYALSHLLGAPALTAAAIRVRLYNRAGVPAAAIARILALSGCLFSTGFITLAGLVLLCSPGSLPDFLTQRAPAGLRALGAACLLLAVLYVSVLQRPGFVRWLRRRFAVRFDMPGSDLACLQIAIGCADTLVAAALLYSLLPSAAGLSFVRLAAVYLAAFAGGLVSGLPAGVGVFDGLLLLGLGGHVQTAGAVAALLLFRVLYFLSPACAAALTFAGLEGRALVRHRRTLSGK